MDIKNQVLAWLFSLQASHPCIKEGEYSLQAIQGDAGFRRYFRIRLASGQTLIVVYSPPDKEKNEAFRNIAVFLLGQGIRVPKIVASDLAAGFFLLEDLGETMLLGHLNEDSASVLYGEAMLTLLRIQQSPMDTTIFPPYDGTALRGEMNLFCDWFVMELLQYSLNAEERDLIEQTFGVLVDSALAQPRVVVHRDYHSRNIVYSEACAPGVIDFQDAVIGPITYDVVSLLRDCYIVWPNDQVQRWALAYASMAADIGIMGSVEEATFLKWFDLMGLQRHIKVLGIFARLSLRDDKHRYLNDLPLVIQYVRDIASQHADTLAFGRWFDDVLMPLVAQDARISLQ